MKTLKSFVNKIIRDKHGKVVMWQTPNITIILWALSTLLSDITGSGRWHNLFDLVAFGALFTWAWMEIFSGSSYFRRGLGAVILIMSLYSRLR